MPSSWMGELKSRDSGPSLPAAFVFGRDFPENNLQSELENAILVLWARLATRTFCPAPACKDLSSAFPEIHRKPQLRTWNLRNKTWQLWTAPTMVGKCITETGWCPRTSSGQIPNKDQCWPRTSSKENQNSNGARLNLGPGVDLGPRLRHW